MIKLNRSHQFLLFVAALTMYASIIAPSANALSGNQFNAGRIIDDFVFSNKNTMSPNDIQVFLNSKVPSCDTNGTQTTTHWNSSAGRYYTRAEWGAINSEPAPYTCLKNYYENPNTKANNLQGAAVPVGARSAAQLIWDVSQQYNLNPQVLLVLLQKEQAIVTDDWPWTAQYRSATGYGCPDTAPCASQYYGFYNQISNAAWQFNYYAAHPTSFSYRAGFTNYVQYNPNASCGGSNVYIQNQATANLYIYTPYQPNASALNNLYETGDTCSAYGNRNFWRMFNDWFGITYANDSNAPHPDGTLISDASGVYIVSTNSRHHVYATAFSTAGFRWSDVRPATTGDSLLPITTPYDKVAEGTIFSLSDGNVYVAQSLSGTAQKQWLSYNAFVSLGYKWSDVVAAQAAEVPTTTTPGIYTSDRHPTGTLVSNQSGVYLMGEASRQHVSPLAFDSNYYEWAKVRAATSADLNVPIANEVDIRQGAVLYGNGSIYIADKDGNGILKRPVGPWECYKDRWHYVPGAWYAPGDTALPSRTGTLLTC